MALGPRSGFPASSPPPCSIIHLLTSGEESSHCLFLHLLLQLQELFLLRLQVLGDVLAHPGVIFLPPRARIRMGRWTCHESHPLLGILQRCSSARSLCTFFFPGREFHGWDRVLPGLRWLSWLHPWSPRGISDQGWWSLVWVPYKRQAWGSFSPGFLKEGCGTAANLD